MLRRRLFGALAAILATLASTPATASAHFTIGLEDPSLEQLATSAGAQAGYAVMRSIAASTVRIAVAWSNVAPAGAVEPRGFDPADPADPRYDWTAVDTAVRTAAANHAHVLLMLCDAPRWAEGRHRPANRDILAGAWDPSPSQFASFAHAAAERYSGSFPDPVNPGATLPRVSDWEIWNEENLPWYLAAPNVVDEYRSLLNAGYQAITSVHPSNVIAIGGLAPNSFLPPLSVEPLTFGAELLCLRRVGTTFVRNGPCPQRAEFDVFAHHPYSPAATPTKHAYSYDNVLVGDMQKIQTLVHTADTLHTDAPDIHHQIWVTEFAWFTDPPNTAVGDSGATAARYVAYSMYEMWRAGVQLVIWQIIKDRAAYDPTGGGLESSAGRPKLMLQAFAFPVIASVSGGRGLVWGRAPVTAPTMVTVQRQAGTLWRLVTTTRTAADGVFLVNFPADGNAVYRALVHGGAVSLPYDSQPIPPRRTHL